MRAVESREDHDVAYVTDVEGSWDRLASFCAGNSFVHLDGERLTVATGATFVFGGDAIDRGPWSRKVVRTLLAAKSAQPSQVVLIAGNRDINKMRLARELTGHPHRRAPEELHRASVPEQLRWIFANTMGAGDAFEHRRAELAAEGRAHDDDDVPQSFLDDLAPTGDLARYLDASQLAFRAGGTLFVHGGVAEDALCTVPGHVDVPLSRFDVDAWIARLDAFYRRHVEAFLAREVAADGTPGWDALVMYQAPRKGLRMNPGSVVYGRMGDELNNPALPEPAVMRALQRSGIHRVVVGHTPNGDTPSIVRAIDADAASARPFEVVIADNSRARVPTGSQLVLRDDGFTVKGRCVVDDDVARDVQFTVAAADRGTPIGRRTRDGSLVKAPVDDAWLLFRYREEYEVVQRLERSLGALGDAVPG